MSNIFQLEGGQYEHPNEYKLVSTVRGTTILQPEFGTVIIEGDVIEASTHNTIQKNGVLASKVNVTMESTDTVLVPTDMTIESDLFNELKIMLLFETGTTLPSNSFIKLKETNVPIANVNDYVVNANTPLLFLYFDSKFYAYKAGSGTESLGDLSDVTLTTPTNGQTLVYNGSKFVNKTVEEPADFQATETINGVSKLATQPEVDNGLEDTKIVTSKKLKARIDSLLTSIATNFVKLTQLATESLAGIIKISTTAQVSAGTDNTTAVSPAKLREAFANSKVSNGYQKLANGTIIQWGAAVYTAPGNSMGNVSSIANNFPLTFPNKVLSIALTGFNDTGGDDGLECLHSVELSSNSAFTLRSTRLVGSFVPGQQGSAYYIAIGY